MNRTDARTIVGLWLVAAGALLLLQELGLMAVARDVLWTCLFLAGGVAFLALFVADRDRWWPLIPGFTLLGLGILVGLDLAAPGVASAWGGSIFLGAMGLAFLAVYWARRENWWAVIPAGVLLTLASVVGASAIGMSREGGSVFFLGLAITFGLVYLVPAPLRSRGWALITAAVMLVLASLAGIGTRMALGWLFPLILILVGAYLVYRSLRTRPA